MIILHSSFVIFTIMYAISDEPRATNFRIILFDQNGFIRLVRKQNRIF